MIEVVTVWAPRPKHPKWRDYMPLLQLQKKSVERVGHKHLVVTDLHSMDGFNTLNVQLQDSLMFAILEAQLAYVTQWSDRHPFLLIDIDCIVLRKLNEVFTNTFDVLLTSRKSLVSPVQNGVMYFSAGCKPIAIRFLEKALALCEPHWGGDQEAISKAVAPIPPGHGQVERFGGRFQFEPTDNLNHSSNDALPNWKPHRFVEHFKGNLKRFLPVYAEQLFKRPIT